MASMTNVLGNWQNKYRKILIVKLFLVYYFNIPKKYLRTTMVTG